MNKFKMWYIPQMPMKAFEFKTDTSAEALAALDLITDFSIFEYDNNVKPDYCDMSGISQWDETEQEWFDYDEYV